MVKCLKFFVVVTLFSAGVASGDCPNALEKPRAVVTVTATEVRPLLEELAQITFDHGFQANEGVDWNGGNFRAVKPESERLQHRIAVWVQWNLHEPGRQLDVYLVYARYRKYTGGDWEVEEPDSVTTNEVMGPLKQAILRLAGFRGGR